MIASPEKIKWGIIGPGNIASHFVSDLVIVDEAEIVAVASRSKIRAEEFARKFGLKKVYASYAEMLENAELDIVYVATPNSLHFNHTLMAMENGISVLCEKPVALNCWELDQMINHARAKNVFFMEALWSRFIPAMRKVLEIIKSGELGEVQKIEAAFCFDASVDIQSILYDLKFGGGSLLDVGIYPVFLSYLLLGKPIDIIASAQLHPSGADQSCVMEIRYAHGASASLKSSIIEESNEPATIALTNGKIIIQPEWYIAHELSVLKDGAGPEKIDCPPGGIGFTHEILECHRCLRAGLLESPLWSHQDSLEVMTILDEVRRQIGVVYPSDSKGRRA